MSSDSVEILVLRNQERKTMSPCLGLELKVASFADFLHYFVCKSVSAVCDESMIRGAAQRFVTRSAASEAESLRRD